MTMQQYCLRWNNHQPNFISVFSSLLNSESLVDVTLAAEGRHLQAHKVVLSACSSYFQSLFTINPCQHPIVILKDVKFTDLKVMVDFMYYGEVNVSQEQLPHILKTAEMLKIKGLAEMPVDQSVSRSHNNSADRAELLTPADATWNIDNTVRQLSPSPCPLSPSSRRKRLRKSSTGSGSGSTERIVEEQHTEVTLTSSTSVQGNIIKTETGYVSDSNISHQKSKQHSSSSDSDLHRGSSHDSVDSEPPHQITLQVPQQHELHHMSQSIESQQSIEVQGHSTNTSQHSTQPLTEKPVSTTHAQLSQQYLHKTQQVVMGTKRHRFLMRQPRIKRECDTGQMTDSDACSTQYLSLPPVKVERQCSDPLPAHSPPPGNLLTVPGVLQKQHSHPLLPSQTHPPLSPPLHVQLISHTHSVESADRSVSPIVVVSDAPTSLSVDLLPRGDSSTTGALRVRTDELKRSTSSPQSSTRSSHCPAVRSGPALGCNFCWNTVDTHGRILRRKTKYHCPECQTNLCIVPCFQEYHERHVSGSRTDPIALTTSVMKIFPKTTSM